MAMPQMQHRNRVARRQRAGAKTSDTVSSNNRATKITPERLVQKKSVAAAKRCGWWAQKFVAQGRRSAPDFIFAKNGRIFFTEFKKTGEDATDLQKDYHKKMREAGMTVYVCDDPVDFISFILFVEEKKCAS